MNTPIQYRFKAFLRITCQKRSEALQQWSKEFSILWWMPHFCLSAYPLKSTSNWCLDFISVQANTYLGIGVSLVFTYLGTGLFIWIPVWLRVCSYGYLYISYSTWVLLILVKYENHISLHAYCFQDHEVDYLSNKLDMIEIYASTWGGATKIFVIIFIYGIGYI